jgi:hypothetical protein
VDPSDLFVPKEFEILGSLTKKIPQLIESKAIHSTLEKELPIL